jgi:transcriptional regulator with XRE-family HTH domain
MNCIKCNVLTVERTVRYHYQECGLDNVWLVNCRARTCPKCKAVYPVLPDAEIAARAIAKLILTKPYKLDGDVVLFLRKLMGLTSEQLAALLATTRVGVSRWENGKTEISALFDFRLRLVAVERLFPVTEQIPLNQEINRVIRVAYTDEMDEIDTIEVPPPHTYQASAAM